MSVPVIKIGEGRTIRYEHHTDPDDPLKNIDSTPIEDLSTITLALSKMFFRSPALQVTEIVPSFTTDGSDGLLEYAIQGNEEWLDVAGDWLFWTQPYFSAGSAPMSDPKPFTVKYAVDL